MKNKTEILKINNLFIGYKTKSGTTVIAENLNFTFKESHLISLIGANGIGKSTFLRTITGIQKPLSGDVFLNNKSISSYNPIGLAQNLSLVLTEKLPLSNLCVYELVALGRQPYTNWIGKLSTEDVFKIDEAIDLTDIRSFIHKKHFEISDGQLQKVLIARALAQDTPVIILDEPTTHLDLFHKVSLFKLLKKLAFETQKCILFSTHDIDLAIQLSDEMVIMTEKYTIQDTPCHLIEKGVFNDVFKEDSILFDAEIGKFTFK